MPHTLPIRPANPLSYWRKTKNLLIYPGHAGHARHLGELSAVTNQSQQRPITSKEGHNWPSLLVAGRH